jgi:hypothetical protein
LGASLRDDAAIDTVGHGRHDDVGDLGGIDEISVRHWPVVDVQTCVKQLPHARFHDIGQLARDDDDRLLGACGHEMIRGQGGSEVPPPRLLRHMRCAGRPLSERWSLVDPVSNRRMMGKQSGSLRKMLRAVMKLVSGRARGQESTRLASATAVWSTAAQHGEAESWGGDHGI